MLVSRDTIKDLIPVAEGYKIFNNDWTAAQDDYDFKDPDTGKAVGTVHRVAGKIACRGNGFHFCENPLDCLNYYPIMQWNKFAKVRGYGQIARHDEDSKVAVEILEIAEILTWDDFLAVIKQQSTENNIYGGRNISGGYYIHGGRNISGGCNISGGRYISGGYDIYGGYAIYGGYEIYGGYDIYGGENCMCVYDLYYCRNCQGCKSCICCLDYTGKNAVFNQQASEQRVNEIKNNIRQLAGDWFPKFTNAYELYAANGQDWPSTPAPKIEARDRTYAYADMPQKLVDYIKSLPEFDADIWYEITGRKEE